MSLERRFRLGYRVAQSGALLHVLGGTLDLGMRRLQPFHEVFLGVPPGGAPEATATLLLALFHALGAALIGGGLAILALLHAWHVTGVRRYGVVAALVALACEGMVGTQMVRLGFAVGAVPLGIAALIVIGVVLGSFQPRSRPHPGRGAAAAP